MGKPVRFDDVVRPDFVVVGADGWRYFAPPF